jgi:putative FmdB family regulatory protein
MPIYEYVCDECHKPFEKIVINKTEKIACPKCGSKRHTMKFSVVNASVKGGDGGSMTGFGGGGGCCPPSGCGCA